MKIVILDGFACNPGDLNWSGIEAFGDLTVYERSAPDQVLARCAGAEIVLTNKTLLGREQLVALPSVKYVGLLSTGTNAVNVAAASECGIVVTNIPAYSTMSVAQNVFALLLELTNQTGLHNQAVHDGAWVRSRDFCFTLAPLVELADRTFGLVGYGAIGRAVAGMALAFGMRVKVCTRTRPDTAPAGVDFVGLSELLEHADVVSLHCPLNDATKELINRTTIRQMKDGAFLINTGRGGLINEVDVAAALETGKLGGVGVDVLSREPPTADNPLLSARNCVITPHISWASKAARTRLIGIATDNIRAFLAGAPIHVVKE